MDIANGTVTTTNAAKIISLTEDLLQTTDGTNQILNWASSGFYMLKGTGTGPNLSIVWGNITQEMSIKTMAVCVGNVAMNVLVLASDPF